MPMGYSFLYMAAMLLCMHLGNPYLPALADTVIPGAESILISFSLGILLLFVGDYVIAGSLREATASAHGQVPSQPVTGGQASVES